MFLINKYQRWYFEIIQKARTRTFVKGYTERHHIIPKFMSGINAKDNLVVLTFREHYIVHWLLPFFVEGDCFRRKALYALMRMGQNHFHPNRPIASWQFVVAKEAARRAVLGVVRGSEYREMMRKSVKNSKAQRAHLDAWNERRKGDFMSETHKEQWALMIEAKRGIPRNEIEKSRMSEGKKRFFRENPEALAKHVARLQEHGRKIAAKNLYDRWALCG